MRGCRRAGRLALATLGLVPGVASAQVSVEASLGGSLQAVEGATVDAPSRGTVAGGVAVDVELDEGRGALSYEADGGTYATPGDWSYVLHRPRARYRFDLGPGGARLFVGATGAVRRNGDAWSSADYSGVGGFANLELRPARGATLRAGYRLDARRFGQMPALDQTEHGLFASLLVNAPSRTTIIAECHLGLKSYAGEGLVVEPEPATVPASGGGGRGGTRGAGNMGPGVRPTLPTDGAEGDRARQLTLLARLAQSLGERTGLSVQVTRRSTGGEVPPAVVTTPAGFFDDGVYDDPFASDLLGLQARLKHVFTGGASLQATAWRLDRDYVATVALGPDGAPLPGEPLREDRVLRAGVDLSLPVFPSRTGAFALALDVGYAWTRSRSNDAFYDYAEHAGGVALRVSR